MRRGLAPLFTVLFCTANLAQPPVHYIVALTNPEHHIVNVTVEIPPGRDTHDLQLPAWNALYQIRDFSQNMNWIRATKQDQSGGPITLTQLNPSRWRLTGAEHGARIDYEMFTDSPGSFGAQFNSHHAFLNLAQVLLYADDTRNQPAQVEFHNLPARWKIATPLAQSGDSFTAPTYDQLVDSPVEIGIFDESDFTASCGTYRVIFDSDSASIKDPKATLQRLVPYLQRIVSAAMQWMNDCPFQSYMFIFQATDLAGSGGMEHAYSTAISLNQKDFTGSLDHFTAVTAHEFFHLWNVKRIRPQSLEPIDYTKENYTPALWFSEGVDTSASDAIRLRAGLLDEPHYLKNLSQQITELENRPAHLTQSVEQASLDAWLEKYPRYNLPGRSVSYYNKGELLGVVLDLTIRQATHDHASLRELFRSMNTDYAKQGKFFADSVAVEHEAETLTHTDLHAFFEKYVGGTEEIPWDSFFGPVGLRVIKADVTFADPEFEAARIFDQPLAVQQVRPGSEALLAGLMPGDVILEIDGEDPLRDFATQIAVLGPGATLRLVVSRNGVRRLLHWKLASRMVSLFRLQDVPDITAQQRSARTAWLFDRGENSAPAASPAPISNQ